MDPPCVCNGTYICGLDEYKSDAELNEVQLFKDYPEHLIYFAVVCCIVFILVGIPGNLLTILALANYRKVRNATAIFIINLSVSDLLNCCLNFPIDIQILYYHHWVGGKALCMAYPILNFGLAGCSVFTIVAITLNRYIMVSHPNMYPTVYRKRNLIIMVFAIWFGAFTMLTPVLTEYWGRISLDPVVGFCTVVSVKDKSSPKMIYIVMGFVFPFTFITICYSRMMWIVRKSINKMENRPIPNDSTDVMQQDIPVPESPSAETSNPGETESLESPLWAFRTIKNTFQVTKQIDSRSSKPTRRDKKLQTMIGSIMIMFFVSHLPIIFTTNFSRNPYGNIIGYIMVYMTTCSNPIIYVVLSSEYRQAYKYLFKKVLRINPWTRPC